MDKLSYRKPLLITREIDLGVFGDYGNDDPDRRRRRSGGGCGYGGGHGFWQTALPIPVADIRKLNLRME